MLINLAVLNPEKPLARCGAGDVKQTLVAHRSSDHMPAVSIAGEAQWISPAPDLVLGFSSFVIVLFWIVHIHTAISIFIYNNSRFTSHPI